MPYYNGTNYEPKLTKTMKNTTEVPNDLLKDAHKEACQKWKTIIEDLAPELFKAKFKVGDWVINNFNDIHKIGYDYDGSKTSVHSFNLLYYNEKSNPNLRLATPSEVEAHLIKEAEKRGFKVGVEVTGLWAKGFRFVINKCSPKWTYYSEDDRLVFENACIYQEGKWATIIPQEEVLTLEERVKRLEEKLSK